MFQPWEYVKEAGDNVKINFRDGGSSTIDVDSFNNKEFVFQKTDKQIGIEKYFKQVDDSINKKQSAKDADVYLKNLSEEEKNQAIEKIRKIKK